MNDVIGVPVSLIVSRPRTKRICFRIDHLTDLVRFANEREFRVFRRVDPATWGPDDEGLHWVQTETLSPRDGRALMDTMRAQREANRRRPKAARGAPNAYA